ncbi:CST complex subunit CTC1-like [Saccostrea echinata]|uniref:CST complex subunit CTC1-like n=1 Tax=Saccostrea echinata TaxID=191078 RepID=UPI002A84158D|nr:CST complex subunit CTC1-like [Saccostrea echinata]
MVDRSEKDKFLILAVDLLQLSRTDEEDCWLRSLYLTFVTTRGCCTLNQYHQFLSGIKRVVKSNYLDYSIISVEELLDRPRNLTVECSTGTPTKTDRQLYRKILSGRFVLTPLSQNDQISFIQLQDNTGSIPCQWTDFSRRKLIYARDSWCILSSWRLVKEGQGTNYIEVTNFIQEENVDRRRKEIKVLSTTDVAVILENKDKLKPGCLNVIGEVSCFSEIIKIKEDLVFCIELQKKVTIIIKDRKYLHWHDLLTPQKEFLFLGLLPTTLYKGTPQEKKVLVPWKKSDIFAPTVENIEVISLSKWLKENCKDEKISLLNPKELIRVSEDQEFCSYQGEVTNVDLENFGLYQLDKTVWLLLSSMSYHHSHRSFHLGSHVTVHNSHMVASKQVPKICLLCCTCSCIRVSQFSDLPPQPKNVKLSEFVRCQLWRYSFSSTQMLQFIRFLISLYTKFTTLCPQFNWLLKRYMTDSADLQKRNYMEEFLSTPHSCFLYKSTLEMEPTCPLFPTLVLCSDISFDTKAIDRQGHNLIQSLRSTDRLNTALYWLYHTEDNQENKTQVLIGYIDFSSRSSKILLLDDTGCHKCLILMEQEKELHSLSSLNGCLVAVQKYSVVYEKFQICQYPNLGSYGEEKYVSDVREELYLTMSLSDMEVLKENKRTRVSGEDNAVRCCIIHKESLLLEGVNCGQPRLRFTAVGYFLDKSWSEEKIHGFVEEAVKFWDNRNETNGISKQDSDNARGQGSQMTATHILLFQGRAVQWYEALHPGHIYWFSSEEKLVPDSTNCSQQSLRKAGKQAGGKMCICVPEDLWVTEELLNFRCTQLRCCVCLNICPVTDISEILKDNCSAQIVSLEGRIKSRRHLSGENKPFYMKTCKSTCSQLCVSTLDNQKISLVVSSLTGAEEVVVYMTLNNISYPLGLLPGHVIRFHNLERKISHSGSVYCQYVVISSVRVLSTESQHLDGEVKNKETKDATSLWEDVPLQRLYEGWRSPGLTRIQTVCHIHNITKLAFKSTCLNCSSVIHQGTCTNRLCDPGHGTNFSASACFSVDDGTSFASVKCYNTVVQRLLELTDMEWSSLEDAVKYQGDIFLTSNCSYESNLEQFLQLLREGNHLHQPKNLLLQVDKHHTSREILQLDKHQNSREMLYNIDKASISDFDKKTVDLGCGKQETRCLPVPQFTCLDIRTLDVSSYIVHNLKVSSKLCDS